MIAKRFLIGGCVASVLVLWAIVFFSAGILQSKIESSLSGIIGLQVRIKGKTGFSLFPVGFTASDVRISGPEGEMLAIEHLRVGIEPIPLLRKQIRLNSCAIIKPTVTAVMDDKGNLNLNRFDRKRIKKWMGSTFALRDLKLSEGTLTYFDRRKKGAIVLKGIDLTLKDLLFGGTLGKGIIRNISFTGSMACTKIQAKDIAIDNVRGNLGALNGLFSFTPVAMEIFGAKGEGGVTVDMSSTIPLYTAYLKAANMDFEKLGRPLSAKRVIGGKGDLAASFTVRTGNIEDFMKDVNGTLSLQGHNLTTYTMDLDKTLSAYETTQKFTLIDIGAFFIAGPVGAAAVKGYHYTDLYYKAHSGTGTITRFISNWKIGDGKAEATDCALTTRRNRVAVKGKLDLVRERYEDLTVAILDDKGCARFKQSITGPFDAPSISTANAVKSIASPVLNIYRQARQIAHRDTCEVFYTGTLEQPRPDGGVYGADLGRHLRW